MVLRDGFAGSGRDAAGSLCLRRTHAMYRTARIAATAITAPTAMPAFAPVESPCEVEGFGLILGEPGAPRVIWLSEKISPSKLTTWPG
jgi:hypothetical protein